jgi:hypothetical protein
MNDSPCPRCPTGNRRRAQQRARAEYPPACDQMREISSRSKWESYWRSLSCWNSDSDDLEVRAIAEVDRLDRVGRPASAISFTEARAFARRHGSRCHCHDGPGRVGAA